MGDPWRGQFLDPVTPKHHGPSPGNLRIKQGRHVVVAGPHGPVRGDVGAAP